MVDANAPQDDTSGEFATFATGAVAKGEFHCIQCGYGVTVLRELPSCPMCGSEEWQQSAWSPFARARLTSQ